MKMATIADIISNLCSYRLKFQVYAVEFLKAALFEIPWFVNNCGIKQAFTADMVICLIR
jgi:hypothetical protein